MFYKTQEESAKKQYIEALSIIGSLSNLFSDSKVPYLYYRIAEKVFCDAFATHDLSRGDIALDAAKDGMGIGLKTFLKNNDKTLQKVAEFNKDRALYEHSCDADIVQTIAKLRNARIHFAQKLSSVESSMYHCVIRSENRFQLYEEKMGMIDIDKISNLKRRKNSILFDDGKDEYSFNMSKSTLLKRFNANTFLDEFEIEIFDNPLLEIQKCFSNKSILSKGQSTIVDTVYLPLYGKDKIVASKSGLNQWNAAGRERHPDEIYIPIPAKIHHVSPTFFPSRDEPFSLKLPNGETIDAKVCQDNSKALMSNPNKTLGKWLLRDILELKEGELLSYEKLQLVGIDSVRIDKLESGHYAMNFATFDSYEEFIMVEESGLS